MTRPRPPRAGLQVERAELIHADHPPARGELPGGSPVIRSRIRAIFTANSGSRLPFQVLLACQLIPASRRTFRTYLVLQNARAPEAAEQAVQLRCRYLDELSRRHPEGFRRWLDDGARAAGDPSRYVRGEPPRRCRDTDAQA